MVKYYGKQYFSKGSIKLENNDQLKKYLAHNKQVRVYLLDATYMVSEIRKLHHLSNVVSAGLGRTLMMTTMMSDMLKEKGNRITVQIKGDGPIGSIVICGNYSLQMKGYVTNPNIELPLNEFGKLDVAKAVGKGYLNVIKDVGLKDPYIGATKLISGEIAEDFAYYFATSEQTPCVVSLGVNISKENQVQKAFGYLIEPLPDCEENIIELLETINTNITSVTNLALDLNNMDDIAKTITGDNYLECIDERKPQLLCDCNEERIERTIIALGKKEATEIAKENKGVLEISCNFCHKAYQYSIEKIEQLFENEKKEG